MHIGLNCPTFSGHLNPMAKLGRELVRRGHRVTLVALPDGKAKAVAAGVELRGLRCDGTITRRQARLNDPGDEARWNGFSSARVRACRQGQSGRWKKPIARIA